MKLFDVGENVEEGWPVSADIRRRRAFLSLGRNRTNYAAFAHFRFGQSLSQVLFPSNLPPRKEDLEDLYIVQGAVAKDDKGLCLVRQRREDTKALVRVGIASGIGGTIRYVFNKGVSIIAEGLLRGTDDAEIPIYILQMEEGASFEVHRDGDLDGLPARMFFTWDGKMLSQSVP